MPRRCRRRRPGTGLSKLARAIAVAITAFLLLVPALRAEELNRIVLRVNDRIITLYEYRQQLAEQLDALNHQPDMEPDERREALATLPDRVLLNMYVDLLIQSRADELKVNITSADVDRSIQRLRESAGLETEEQMQQALASEGITMERLRELRESMLRQQVVMEQEVMSRVEPEEDDLRRFYRDNPEYFQVPERRKLREVVVLETSELGAAERAALAREIRGKLAAGTEPANVVESSAEAGTTSGVIVLGWVPEGDLAPALEEAVAGLEVGQWSEPVAARGGLHLIQLQEREEATVRSFAEVRDEIYAREKQRLSLEEYPRYLKELEEQSFIVTDPPAEAASFRDHWDVPGGPADPLEAFRRAGEGAGAGGADGGDAGATEGNEAAEGAGAAEGSGL